MCAAPRDSAQLAREAKALAMEEGFVAAGVASAHGPLPNAEVFRRWLARGGHGEMAYLERNLAKRIDPSLLVPGAQSVLCLAVACGEGGRASSAPLGGEPVVFDPEASDRRAAGPLVARYARGRDYHKVLKRKCVRLMDRLRELAPSFAGRAFVDSAPVMERTLAAAAGVGWIGANGCLHVPGRGSHVLLCEIVSNLPLAADGPIASGCDRCGACVKACPTGAIDSTGLVDARRCVSCLTIECRGTIEREFWPLMGGRLFGCDRCQEACPHNRSLPPGDAELSPSRPPLGGADLARVLRWSREDWDAATRGAACRRASWEMFLRSAAIAAGCLRDKSLAPALAALAGRGLVPQDLIDWAIAMLSPR
jgi:epoxyqueuosine reductase